MAPLRELTRQFPRAGCLQTILLRPARREPMRRVDQVLALLGRGLDGDRAAVSMPSDPAGGKRQVTLIQAEHLPCIAALAGRTLTGLR